MLSDIFEIRNAHLQKYRCADLKHLCIVGNLPLDVLEKIMEESTTLRSNKTRVPIVLLIPPGCGWGYESFTDLIERYSIGIRKFLAIVEGNGRV